MTRALWLLLGLRLKGWVRRLGKSMASVRGAMLVLFSVALILLWILPNLIRGPASAENLVHVRRFGPFVLAALCFMNVLLSASERVIAFSPAEINFLFPGPVSRRQLLLYKIIIGIGGAIFTGLLMGLVLRPNTSMFLAGFVGMTLAVMFIQLSTMVVALAGSTVGAKAHTRPRRILLAVLFGVLALGVTQTLMTTPMDDAGELLNELEKSRAVQILLTPFQWFVNAFTATSVWPDLVQWAAIALAVNVLLMVVSMLLDAQYLETAAAASERLYARLQRIRQTGTAAVSLPAGKPRFGMFGLPRWGGVGTLAWRQLTTALRSMRTLLSIVLIFGLALMPMAFQKNAPNDDGQVVFIGSLLIGMTLFIQPLIPFDFRGDLDRMEFLKVLPVQPWRLVLGQLLAPVLIVTVFQWLILFAVQIIWQRWEPFLLAIIVFGIPVNLLFFSLENLLFLMFPTRLVATSPGDLHLFGRNMLLWFAKILCMTVLILPPMLFAVPAYFASGGSWPAALAAAWVGVVADLALMIPLAAIAFQKFDVARDTPA